MTILATLLMLAPLVQGAPPSPADPVETDWRSIPDDEIMVITFADKRTVVVRLAPKYAPEHVANIRLLARAGWWNDASVYRVQENWVTQWGDATEKKPLPPTAKKVPAAEFDIAAFTPAQRLGKPDPRSTASGISADGWPMATDGKAAWLTHCYAMVGVARDASPDTGTGAELFTPIGQSARRLDRNYTVVGRIIEGMGHMASMPRSDAPMGVYANAAERTGIVSARLAADIPAAERPKFQYRAADNPRFAALIKLRENPLPPTIGMGGADVCEIPLVTRRITAP
jgi:cyclophilin family peptidyl-prolyl cis-trans isomerase